MTNIEWTHPPGFRGESWNPVTGCAKVSAGCKHCYAEGVAERFWLKQYPMIDGRPRRFTDVLTHPERLDAPLSARAPRCYFVNSMSDLFHESVSDEFIAAVFGVMAVTPQHRYIVLTKRPARMLDWFAGAGALRCDPWTECHAAALALDGDDRIHRYEGGDPARPWPLPNVILGVSAEDQATADERIPLLLQTPAAVRCVSLEPLLGPVSLRQHDDFSDDGHGPRWLGTAHNAARSRGLDWLIVGGESGPGARTCNVEWIRDIVRQGRKAGVATFVKQLGGRPRAAAKDAYPNMPIPMHELGDAVNDACGGSGYPMRIRDRKGGDVSEWPEDLRVREWPRERGR